MNDNHDGTSKNEMMWPIHQINWQRSRYVYDMHFVHNRISRQVLNYCVQQKYADSALIAKWKRPEYARLCCIQAIDDRALRMVTPAFAGCQSSSLEKTSLLATRSVGAGAAQAARVVTAIFLVTSTASDLQRSKFSEKSF